MGNQTQGVNDFLTEPFGDFLPDLDQAVADKDHEALNLLSRYHLAEYAKEQKVTLLEEAWKVTQAVLAADPAQPISGLKTMEQALSSSLDSWVETKAGGRGLETGAGPGDRVHGADSSDPTLGEPSGE